MLNIILRYVKQNVQIYLLNIYFKIFLRNKQYYATFGVLSKIT